MGWGVDFALIVCIIILREGGERERQRETQRESGGRMRNCCFYAVNHDG